jgi:hypothetical protein
MIRQRRHRGQANRDSPSELVFNAAAANAHFEQALGISGRSLSEQMQASLIIHNGVAEVNNPSFAQIRAFFSCFH